MEDPASQALLGPILLIVLLTLINAFLAGAEMAFVSSNPAKLKELADQGDKKAKKALLLLDDSDTFLSAIQVGITFGGFFNSASASQTFVSILVGDFCATLAPTAFPVGGGHFWAWSRVFCCC